MFNLFNVVQGRQMEILLTVHFLNFKKLYELILPDLFCIQFLQVMLFVHISIKSI